MKQHTNGSFDVFDIRVSLLPEFILLIAIRQLRYFRIDPIDLLAELDIIVLLDGIDQRVDWNRLLPTAFCGSESIRSNYSSW